MGNCSPKPRKAVPEAIHSVGSGSPPPPPPPLRLRGPAACTATSRLRIALHYKNAEFQFSPSGSCPALEHGGKVVEGTPEAILQYIDANIPGPSLHWKEAAWQKPATAQAAALQHRSMERHLERMGRWAAELVEAGGAGGAGKRRLEVRRLRRSYTQLVELMLEHAQMEERVVFPVLDGAHKGLCTEAKEEHARDLPIMNGVKEDVKSVVALEPGGAAFQEALINLSLRLRTLHEHCKQHFAEEERELLPLMEAVERGRGSSGRREAALEKLVEVMEGTHSHLFAFLMAGLLPHEAMQYLDIMAGGCRDQRRLTAMLRSLEARLEAAGTAATTQLGHLLQITTTTSHLFDVTHIE